MVATGMPVTSTLRLLRRVLSLRAFGPWGIDFHLIANFLALALITLAGPAVIFILFYRRGAL